MPFFPVEVTHFLEDAETCSLVRLVKKKVCLSAKKVVGRQLKKLPFQIQDKIKYLHLLLWKNWVMEKQFYQTLLRIVSIT